MILHFDYNPVVGLIYRCEEGREMTHFNTSAIPKHMSAKKALQLYFEKGIFLFKSRKRKRLVTKYNAIFLNGKECRP